VAVAPGDGHPARSGSRTAHHPFVHPLARATACAAHVAAPNTATNTVARRAVWAWRAMNAPNRMAPLSGLEGLDPRARACDDPVLWAGSHRSAVLVDSAGRPDADVVARHKPLHPRLHPWRLLRNRPSARVHRLMVLLGPISVYGMTGVRDRRRCTASPAAHRSGAGGGHRSPPRWQRCEPAPIPGYRSPRNLYSSFTCVLSLCGERSSVPNH